jgi:aromatic-L-amino-acid/L-tryptophan decarboxylase
MSVHPLEPGRDEMLAMGGAVLDELAGFVEGLPDAPSVDLDGLEDLVPELLLPPAEQPGDFRVLLDRLQQAMGRAVETAGPSYLAYIPGGGLFTSALAELVTRVYNRYTGVSALGPGPVAMEQGVMEWLCREFDLPPGALGVVSTGGSMATVSALVAARERMLGEDFSDGTLYVTEHTHLCVAKAARVVGFPAARVRVVPTSPDLRMDPEAAARIIAQDRADGLRPAVLVGTAGTTDSGTVDDLDRLAELCRTEDLWFHVDGAYGGFFQLTAWGRRRLAGIERADSIVLDPHKGLFLPFGTGVLLVRDRATLQAAFGSEASYLQDLHVTETLPDYNSLTPELTREARGPRLWLPLHLHGVSAFRDALEEKLDLAAGAYRALTSDPRIETDGPPDLTVVTFRLRGGDDDDHRRWLERINASRRVHLSSTRIGGRYTLRLCVLSHRTHADRVDEAVELIRAQAPGRATTDARS